MGLFPAEVNPVTTTTSTTTTAQATTSTTVPTTPETTTTTGKTTMHGDSTITTASQSGTKSEFIESPVYHMFEV